ncbi:TetR family transcriptional regulator [Pseudonocardia kujensis]|uniref:TetR/AcrR family transcriptional regulator n=1 Tax=Pseudonocardia kujensis TaxID=1128675 RepID=UPI001E4CDEE2|nr:TetR family transcriptional regulator [Pseudonocardia kujensis]MCE0763509.1 TetR family transcriptional regulator [Pseudonocardia kujensis]
MTDFQRARTPEQRQVRRSTILATAREMLSEMGVSELSFNRLSERAGLAKSNILRYFDSREAILLELLDDEQKAWLADLGPVLAQRTEPNAPVRERVAALAESVAESLTARPLLNELVSAQASVLEHNVSPDGAARYKRAALDNVRTFATLIGRSLPELPESGAVEVAGALVMLASSAWTYSQPSAAMRAAYEADPDLAAHCIVFRDAIEHLATLLISGALASRTR